MAAGQRRARLTVRVFAVDWSGKADGGRETIWLAEVCDGVLARLENGRSRDQVVEELLEAARAPGTMVVGLDFAFSLPAWWVGDQGCANGPELWKKMAGGMAEEILGACSPPFWGRPGKRRPPCDEPLRRTDRMSVGGITPKSVFQIGGAGAVGTGSLRGMPALHRLREGGMAIWPFMPAGDATVVEIYPRSMTGPVNKSSLDQRQSYLTRWPQLATAARARAAGSEDAFDAAVSALVMWAHRRELSSLPPARDAVELVEGLIWSPPCVQIPTPCGEAGCARARVLGGWREHVDALLQLPPADRLALVKALMASLEGSDASAKKRDRRSR